MMKRITSLAYAAVLLSSYAAQANVSLEMPSYFSVLAAQSQELKKAQKQINLTDGQQQVLIRFESPRNPHSTAQSMGYIHSQPLLVTFSAQDDVIKLVAPRIDTPQEIVKFAKAPKFDLINGEGQSVEYKMKAIGFSGSPLLADYNALLAEQIMPRAEAAPTQNTISASHKIAVAPVVTSTMTVEATPVFDASSKTVMPIDVSKLSPTQRQELLKSLYQQADETQRKTFMRWALGL
ncbi:DUF2057 domain-containing protein [Photobacterium damselae]|uniref:DUF2057 domain-containing protein n=3 Tax=Photobacterium damselae TaxID=38293 RepID=UPI001EFE13FD|nr:DUF2057 domain-containing protein [Photobacterium damselae]